MRDGRGPGRAAAPGLRARPFGKRARPAEPAPQSGGPSASRGLWFASAVALTLGGIASPNILPMSTTISELAAEFQDRCTRLLKKIGVPQTRIKPMPVVPLVAALVGSGPDVHQLSQHPITHASLMVARCRFDAGGRSPGGSSGRRRRRRAARGCCAPQTPRRSCR